MKRLVLTLVLSALLTAPALAQNTGSQSLTKARELMGVMNVEKTLTGHMSDAENIQRSGAFLISKIAEANPGEESKIGDVLVDADRRILPQIVPGYIEYMAETYAMHFTPQELDQLIGFYKSDAMQSALQKSAESTDTVEFDSDQRDQSNAFLQTPTGMKLQKESPLIMKQINLYAADVVRKKQRNLVYAALREDLPKNDLKVPVPFTPDTFIDKTIHDNTVKANTMPSAVPKQSIPAQSTPKQSIPLQGVAQPPAAVPQQSVPLAPLPLPQPQPQPGVMK